MGVIKKGDAEKLGVTEYSFDKKGRLIDKRTTERLMEAKKRIIKKDEFSLDPTPMVILRDPKKPKPVVKPVHKDGKLVRLDITCVCGERIRINFDYD